MYVLETGSRLKLPALYLVVVLVRSRVSIFLLFINFRVYSIINNMKFLTNESNLKVWDLLLEEVLIVLLFIFVGNRSVRSAFIKDASSSTS